MRKPMNKLLVVFTIFICTLVTPQAFAGGKVGDADITYWVKDALRHDPRVDASEITASTKEGIVTLSGSVDNLSAKKYADLEAKKINGVLGVVNKITVMPSYRSDTDIRNAIRRRILNSAVIESQGLKVTCVQGKVSGGFSEELSGSFRRASSSKLPVSPAIRVSSGFFIRTEI